MDALATEGSVRCWCALLSKQQKEIGKGVLGMVKSKRDKVNR